MATLGMVLALAVLLGGVVGYVAAGSAWLLVVAAIGLVGCVSGWVLTHGGSRQR